MMDIQKADSYLFDSSSELKLVSAKAEFKVANDSDSSSTAQLQPADSICLRDNPDNLSMSDQFKQFSQSIQHFFANVKSSAETSNRIDCSQYDGSTAPEGHNTSTNFENALENNTGSNGEGAGTAKGSTRRARLRRNPVWQYFRVQNFPLLAVCLNCEYNTGSVYSTNLKVHLRSHHPSLFELVRKAEEAIERGNRANALSSRSLNSHAGNSRVLSPESVEDEDSGKDSRPPTRGDLVSPQSAANGAEVTPQSALESFLQFPSLSSNYFAQNKIISSNLESVLREAQLNAANLLASSTTTTNLPTESLANASMPAPIDIARTLANLSVPANSDGAGEENITFEDDGSSENFRATKRKRLRRHPVWRYFKDVDEKTVGCVMCNFKTRSAFSTNLKMHLRAHHKEQFLSVMEMELEQCNLETNANGLDLSTNQLDDNNNGLRRLKRKRKSVEEIQGIINKCKVNLAKERQRRGSVDTVASSRIDENAVWNSPQQQQVHRPTHLAADPQAVDANKSLMSAILQALQTKKPAIESPLNTQQQFASDAVDSSDSTRKTSIERLNSMIGAIIKNDIPCDNNNNSNNVGHTNANNGISAILQDSKSEAAHLDEIRRLFEFCSANKNETDQLLHNVVMKQAIDLVLKRLVVALDSPKILTVPAFRLLISALLPEYDWNQVDVSPQ